MIFHGKNTNFIDVINLKVSLESLSLNIYLVFLVGLIKLKGYTTKTALQKLAEM